MKKLQLFSRGKTQIGKWTKIFSMCLLLTGFASCIDGYKDDEIWSPSVRNATLESPAADDIVVNFSADGTSQTIKWPLVMGAGGYEISVYNVDDPDNPVLISKADQVVDGVSLTLPSTEDTQYKLSIRTLGNPKNNNKEAETATEKLYNNMLPVTAVIPNGTNITEYFTNNPIPESTTQLCYELEAGGNYTMTGNVSTGLTSVTFRGSKVEHANLSVTDGSFVTDGAGLKLQFIDMDYSGFSGAVLNNAVILMNPVINPNIVLNANAYAVVPTTSPVAIQSCKITGLVQYLFFDNSKKYAIGTFLIKDCVIGQNTNTFNQALIRFAAGMLKDFTITNSTLYNEKAPSNSSNRFMQISSGNASSVDQTATEKWTSGSLTITNCTFYQVGKEAQSFNSNGAMGLAADKVTIQKNVFVDCYENGRIISRFRRGNTTAAYAGGENTQWYNGQLFTGSQDVTADVAYFTTDPQLTYLGNGMFKMSGSQQITSRTGDPRWLPAQ